MPSYVEGADSITVTLGEPTLKPILFTTYTPITKYNLEITYEDSTTKTVELVMDKERPYKVVYKKDAKLHTVTGIFSKVYEINESSKFCDFVNRTMDASDLVLEMDCSEKYECTKVRFYLKDIRDIIDLELEGYITDSQEVTKYPIYLNGNSCKYVTYCEVDENLEVTLDAKVTKDGKEIEPWGYADFQILSISEPGITVNTEKFATNKVPLVFTEEALGKDIYIIIKYFVYEIDHIVCDEFLVVASKKTTTDDKPVEEDTDVLDEPVTTQDTQYLGDDYEVLDLDLTPGFKPYRYKNK